MMGCPEPALTILRNLADELSRQNQFNEYLGSGHFLHVRSISSFGCSQQTAADATKICAAKGEHIEGGMRSKQSRSIFARVQPCGRPKE